MYQFVKRGIDSIGAVLGLILFALSYPFVAFAIKHEDGGPILVQLSRISNGKTIQLYKFRSMVVGAAHLKAKLLHRNERNDGPFFKIKNDPRITRVGRVIRRFRIDELPQFINVLKGEISLVGPRPHEPGEVQHYPKEFKALSTAKTGMTGLSQVNGASSLPFAHELELDQNYLNCQSLWLDLKILIKTIWIMLADHNAA